MFTSQMLLAWSSAEFVMCYNRHDTESVYDDYYAISIKVCIATGFLDYARELENLLLKRRKALYFTYVTLAFVFV